MRFLLTADYNWESKLDHAIKNLELRDFFAERKYGEDLSGGIGVVLMCRDPAFDLKQRIRLKKKEQALSMDVMLDLPFFVSATHAQRREVVAKSLISEVPRIVKKYRFTSFDVEKFSSDLERIVSEQLLGVDASRFDHLCLERASGF
jgi:hypothetical protein